MQQPYTLNGGHDLAGQVCRRRNGTAQPAHYSLGDAATDTENSGHNFHTIPYGGFSQDEPDQMTQYIFRPLEIPEAGGALEDRHSEKQHQKPIADAYQGIVDAEDQTPYRPALECLRGLGQQRPYFC